MDLFWLDAGIEVEQALTQFDHQVFALAHGRTRRRGKSHRLQNRQRPGQLLQAEYPAPRCDGPVGIGEQRLGAQHLGDVQAKSHIAGCDRALLAIDEPHPAVGIPQDVGARKRTVADVVELHALEGLPGAVEIAIGEVVTECGKRFGVEGLESHERGVRTYLAHRE